MPINRKSLKSKIIELEQRLPWLGMLARRYHYRIWFNTVRRIVRGGNNRVAMCGVLVKNMHIDICGRGNSVTIGRGSIIRNLKIYIHGDNNRISLGENCRINIGGELWIEDHDVAISLGKDTSIEHAHIAATEPHRKIIIGDDCMFSRDIEVRTGDSHSIIDASSGVRINYAQDVIIGNHVWIGARALILKGTRIADNSVVATGAIVTGAHDTPGVILAGIPAKPIKVGINWMRQRIYGAGSETV